MAIRTAWTFLFPSAMLNPGEQTEKFRLVADQLLVNEQGSSIVFEDYRIALVDELEKPVHSRQKFLASPTRREI